MKILQKSTDKLMGSINLTFAYDFPILKPKDDLKFGKEFADVYEESWS